MKIFEMFAEPNDQMKVKAMNKAVDDANEQKDLVD